MFQNKFVERLIYVRRLGTPRSLAEPSLRGYSASGHANTVAVGLPSIRRPSALLLWRRTAWASKGGATM